jgi:hypothetical protein
VRRLRQAPLGFAGSREVSGVCQKRLDQSGVAIEWMPSDPTLGRKVLANGQAVYYPTDGKFSAFPGH